MLNAEEFNLARPDISVIVITYNDAAHLAHAVESALQQTHQNVEVLICDDHSTDETPALAKELCTNDSRVSYFRRDQNSGSPGAPLNDGLDRALGDFVMFLGSDDALTPSACQSLWEVARETGVDIVSGLLNRVLLTNGGKKEPWYPELHSERRVVQSLVDDPRALQDTLTTNKMYRREFLENIGARFPDDMLYEDVVFSAHTLAEARGIAFIPDEVYEWNVYPREVRESITNQRHTAKNLDDRLRAISRAEQALESCSEQVLAEFHDKVLAHHLRFYLNDFIESPTGEAAASDEWCATVLETIRPRLEKTPISAFQRRFLGDRALYAAALVGDLDGVRAILYGKRVGALAGRIYREGATAFWAPRDRNSRPVSSPLALALSDVSDRVGGLKTHQGFAYLYEINSVSAVDGGIELDGTATDPLGVLAHSGARLELQLHTNSDSVRVSAPAVVTRTPEGIAWSATLPPLAQLSPADGEARMLTMHAFNAAGEENLSQVRGGRAVGSVVGGSPIAAQADAAEWELVGASNEAARFEFMGVVAASPKRVVVIGDVSWRGRYHLGDEAMTEVAIDELRRRGLAVTLVAGEADLSSEFYGVPCVSVFGFAKQRSREARERKLEEILAWATGSGCPTAGEMATIASVKSADAVVIAGGGNLNANGSHHIYERLALTRIARSAGVPVYVSSQTVGPSLAPEDRSQLQEIAQYARVFGSRERATAELMREICGPVAQADQTSDQHALVVRTLDDAVLLKPASHLAELKERLKLPAQYAVGSFTYHAWSTGLTREEYYRELAEMIDDVVGELDVDLLLLPHMGVLGESFQTGTDNDVFGHDRIVSYTKSGRVQSLPLVSAREVLAITQGAELSISTRYHPVVFGAAVGVPAIGIVTSYYSALRMRGALSAFGMESFAIPFEHWKTFGRRAIRAVRDGDFAEHAGSAGAQQRSFQTKWWDGIAASITGEGDLHAVDVLDVDPHEWTNEAEAALLAVARVSQEGTNMYRMNNMITVERHLAEIDALKVAVDRSRREFDEQKRVNEELREAITELRHRMRPPGAELRDKVRRKLRNLRAR